MLVQFGAAEGEGYDSRGCQEALDQGRGTKVSAYSLMFPERLLCCVFLCVNGPFRKLSRAMLVTSFGGQIMGKNSEFLVFMDAEDSSEGLVKAATWKKVYKCLEVC